MTEPVAYYVLEERSTSEQLARRYTSRGSAEIALASAGSETHRILAMSRHAKIIPAETDGPVPQDCCAMARAGRGDACQTQCEFCRDAWPYAGTGDA